jgi:hypothetical protein
MAAELPPDSDKVRQVGINVPWLPAAGMRRNIFEEGFQMRSEMGMVKYMSLINSGY